MKFIDESAPEEDRFNAMKTLFLKSVFKDSSEEKQLLSYQFMKLCKGLESSDLLIIKAAYDIGKGRLAADLKSTEIDPNVASAEGWLKIISKQIGHGIMSLVEVNEDKLVNLKLISPRIHSDRSGIRSTKNYRLTDLGLRVCEYIYE